MTLHLLDEETRADLTTYVARARRIDDGAVRLQATGRALAAWVGVLAGRGLAGDGTVIGLRVLPLAEAGDEDAVVPLSAVADRLARSRDLEMPPTRMRAAWAAISAPRGGWQLIGEISVETLRTVAAEGISQISAGAPEGSGAAAVESLRHRIWGRGMSAPGGADGLPAGVAFAAEALGFLVGDSAAVHAAGRWHRVSTPAGHVLVR